MATNTALTALEETREALEDIKSRVQPLLEKLRNSGDDKEIDLAQARSGVALTIGTLRFMAQRLSGTKGESNDALRLELNRIRKLLVQVQQKAASYGSSSNSDRNSKVPLNNKRKENENKSQADTPNTRRRIEAEEGMKSSSTATPVQKRRRRK